MVPVLLQFLELFSVTYSGKSDDDESSTGTEDDDDDDDDDSDDSDATKAKKGKKWHRNWVDKRPGTCLDALCYSHRDMPMVNMSMIYSHTHIDMVHNQREIYSYG